MTGVQTCALPIFAFTLPFALRAAGDASFTMVVSIVSMWTLRIGGSYLFACTNIFGLISALGWPASFGAMSVWFAMIIDWWLRAALFVWRFASGKWKSKKVI